MSALATEERPQTGPAASLFEPNGSTLEEIILGAWEDLAARAAAECPVCGGTLLATGCTGCGSQLE